jgi:hypothetical protein
MPEPKASEEISTGISKLSLKSQDASQSAKGRKSRAAKKVEVVDDWEDEAGSDDAGDANEIHPADITSGTTEEDSRVSPTTKSEISAPTVPVANPGQSSLDYGLDNESSRSAPRGTEVPRPEKTDAVARRMIAASLGMKMPKRTEEQKEYDKAMREKERKRRDEEREVQRRKDEAAAKAKQAIWDD